MFVVVFAFCGAFKELRVYCLLSFKNRASLFRFESYMGFAPAVFACTQIGAGKTPCSVIDSLRGSITVAIGAL